MISHNLVVRTWILFKIVNIFFPCPYRTVLSLNANEIEHIYLMVLNALVVAFHFFVHSPSWLEVSSLHAEHAWNLIVSPGFVYAENTRGMVRGRTWLQVASHMLLYNVYNTTVLTGRRTESHDVHTHRRLIDRQHSVVRATTQIHLCVIARPRHAHGRDPNQNLTVTLHNYCPNNPPWDCVWARSSTSAHLRKPLCGARPPTARTT